MGPVTLYEEKGEVEEIVTGGSKTTLSLAQGEVRRRWATGGGGNRRYSCSVLNYTNRVGLRPKLLLTLHRSYVPTIRTSHPSFRVERSSEGDKGANFFLGLRRRNIERNVTSIVYRTSDRFVRVQ